MRVPGDSGTLFGGSAAALFQTQAGPSSSQCSGRRGRDSHLPARPPLPRSGHGRRPGCCKPFTGPQFPSPGDPCPGLCSPVSAGGSEPLWLRFPCATWDTHVLSPPTCSRVGDRGAAREPARALRSSVTFRPGFRGKPSRTHNRVVYPGAPPPSGLASEAQKAPLTRHPLAAVLAEGSVAGGGLGALCLFSSGCCANTPGWRLTRQKLTFSQSWGWTSAVRRLRRLLPRPLLAGWSAVSSSRC